MMTREEQIAELRQDLRSGKTDIVEWEDMSKQCIATTHILEAERRAEQRVRAEIGRDSERLDWLVGVVQSIHRTSNMPTQWILEFRTKLASFDRDDLRQAIDAAREAG